MKMFENTLDIDKLESDVMMWALGRISVSRVILKNFTYTSEMNAIIPWVEVRAKLVAKLVVDPNIADNFFDAVCTIGAASIKALSACVPIRVRAREIAREMAAIYADAIDRLNEKVGEVDVEKKKAEKEAQEFVLDFNDKTASLLSPNEIYHGCSLEMTMKQWLLCSMLLGKVIEWKHDWNFEMCVSNKDIKHIICSIVLENPWGSVAEIFLTIRKMFKARC